MVKVVAVGFLKDLKDYLYLLHLQIKSNHLAINMIFSLKFIEDDKHFETFDVEVQNFYELLTIARVEHEGLLPKSERNINGCGSTCL